MAYFVLDTGIVRSLAHGEPAWFPVLRQLRCEGHRFALHDLVAAELSTQMLDLSRRGKLGPGEGQADFDLMCDRLSALIPEQAGAEELAGPPEVPLWPGRVEMLQIYPDPPFARSRVAKQFREVSRARHRAIIAVLRAGRFVETRAQLGGEVVQFGSPQTLASAPSALQSSRDSWRTMMRKCVSMRLSGGLPDLDEATRAVIYAGTRKLVERVPDVARRLDLAFRYFAWYQYSVAQPEPAAQLSPDSPKRVNDGIDSELPFALFYPCYVLTEDSRFLRNIDHAKRRSPQGAYVVGVSDVACVFPQ